jgi:hypothetical protein
MCRPLLHETLTASAGEAAHSVFGPAFPANPMKRLQKHIGGSKTNKLGAVVVVCILLLVLAAGAFARASSDDEGYDPISRRGLEQIDRLNELLQQAGKVFLGAGVVLLAVIVLKVASPFQAYGSTKDRLLKRAVRDVDDLLKRIHAEAEAAENTRSNTETTDEGLLAGMAEIAEFNEAEQVPSYVLTVNDLMLDNVAIALKRLRRFKEANADKYRDYMFSVIKGIKTITEQSAESGVASGLAVDIKEYFKDDRRYRVWRRLLRRFARKGEHREVADAFLLFMRALGEGRSPAAPKPTAASAEKTAVYRDHEASVIPDILNEETLPAIQEAAVKEAANLRFLVLTGRPAGQTYAWQFEFVKRQRQLHTRDEAQRMLAVFLSCESKALREVTGIRMLPCRTWGHVLHVLGVESGSRVRERADDRLLAVQEIIILEKAFLQTFARRESLARLYGHGESAALMMDVHLPEIRRETLMLLRRLHRTELARLGDATAALNEEETPRNSQVKRLIEHYVYRRHDPPGLGEKPGAGSEIPL